MVSFFTTLTLAAAAMAAPMVLPELLPRDDNAGCTKASFGKFSWDVTNFTYFASWQYTNPSHQVASGVVDFQLSNPALTYAMECHAVSTQLQDFFYGDVNYDCTLPAGVTSRTTGSFSFNQANGQLKLTQKWTCSDDQPEFPTTITANGDYNFTLGADNCVPDEYKNDDWQEGETYSYKSTNCTFPDVTVLPTQMSAVA